MICATQRDGMRQSRSPITGHTVEHRTTGFLGENQCPYLRLALHL
jgi:hypothetical protein